MLTVANRKAEWIWRRRPGLRSFAALPFSSPDYEQGRNLYVYFRRTVHLPDVPAGATGPVSADGPPAAPPSGNTTIATTSLLCSGLALTSSPSWCTPTGGTWPGISCRGP